MREIKLEELRSVERNNLLEKMGCEELIESIYADSEVDERVLKVLDVFSNEYKVVFKNDFSCELHLIG